MDGKVLTTKAYNKNCFGCKNSNTDVMVSMQTDTGFNDFFLTQAQAQYLLNDLQKVLAQNKEEPTHE